jgi:hypothetical protein
MNRKALLGLVLSLAAATASALNQPQRINFQGKLIDPATNNPKTGPVSLTFNLYNAPTGGSSLYTETQNGVPLTNGVFSVEVGTLTAIPRDLFLGASSYLGVTVVGDAAGEMVPRQNLVMSAYAFTANQLSDISEVRLVAGLTYSTFTNAGNLAVPGGVSGSSGSFTNGITASSGTFLAVGGNQYSLVASSGVQINAGTLDVNGSGGITNTYGIMTSSLTATGIQTSTLTWIAITQPLPLSAAAQGSLYFDSTVKKLEISQDNGSWQILIDTRTETMWAPTVTHPQVTGVSAFSAVANQVKCVRYYITENFLVERMAFEVTTAGGIADVGFYDDATKNQIVHTGGLSIASTGVKSATGLSGFLKKGTMYRYCFCSSTTTGIGRSVSTTNVTFNLENAFVASPTEGTSSVGCAAGVLPATLGTITSATVIPVLSVIANTTGP